MRVLTRDEGLIESMNTNRQAEALWPLLTRVSRPGRYVGGEWGSLPVKGGSPLRVCLAYPDTYEVGMSYLGYQILFALIKSLDFADVERVYCPWPDMESQLRGAGLDLGSLESGRPLSKFDVVGFTLQYELCHTNILTMLDLGGVELEAGRRGDEAPLVIGGGPVAMAPSPLARFFDAFCIGDGEELLPEVLTVLESMRGSKRDERISAIAGIPGVYVPGVSSAPVRKRIVTNPDESFLHRTMIVPSTGVIHDRVAVQVFRGCTRGCRFCQAGMTDRPPRERGAESAASQIRDLLDYTGWEEVGLLSLATCDWTPLNDLLADIGPELARRNVRLSLPSLRMDGFSVELASTLEGVRRGGLTFAPEAGSERLRGVINKSVCDEDIALALDATFRHGWDRVKLYFMMGLPTETEQDLLGVLEIARIARAAARKYGRRGEVAVSLSGFVPKAHTPFQWAAQVSRAELRARGRFVKGRMSDRRVSVSYHEPEQTWLEGVFARGDERLGEAIEEAWRRGARFDGWTETFDASRWQSVFEDLDIDADAYTGPRDLDAALPWDIIDCGVDKAFLAAEYRRGLGGVRSICCRDAECLACGWQGKGCCR